MRSYRKKTMIAAFFACPTFDGPEIIFRRFTTLAARSQSPFFAPLFTLKKLASGVGKFYKAPRLSGGPRLEKR